MLNKKFLKKFDVLQEISKSRLNLSCRIFLICYLIYNTPTSWIWDDSFQYFLRHNFLKLKWPFWRHFFLVFLLDYWLHSGGVISSVFGAPNHHFTSNPMRCLDSILYATPNGIENNHKIESTIIVHVSPQPGISTNNKIV